MDWKKAWSQLRSLGKNTWYVHCYKHTPVDPHKILLESRVGYSRGDIDGNILRLTQELCTDAYKDYQVYVSYSEGNKQSVQRKLDKLGIRGVRLVASESYAYYKLLCSAKYLFNDVTFPSRFIKKRSQVYANTWHGTALKCLGKNVPYGAWSIGNTQRNFLMADYIIQPSVYAAQRLREAYNLAHIYQGTYLYAGLPRNSIFYKDGRREKLRAQLGLNNKRVYAYMPTWRGVADNQEAMLQKMMQVHLVRDYFKKIDQMLGPDEVFYAKFHPFVGDALDLSPFTHIKPFPEGYDPYEILNVCDCLVTDYSSVFFDYANVKNGKIVLFCYDKESYASSRSFYLPLEELPFPQVDTAEELVKELRRPVDYDAEDFRREYCTYDNPHSAQIICREILLGERSCNRASEKDYDDGKLNLLFYMGRLQKNGMMTAYHNLLSCLGQERFHYFTAFDEEPVGKDPRCLRLIPACTDAAPITAGLGRTYRELAACILRYRGKRDWKWVNRILDKMYQRAYERNYGYAKLDLVIQYTGYGSDALSMFRFAPCRRVVFVHNDMEMELKTKGMENRWALRDAYRSYDYVAAVSKDILPSVKSISGREDNLRVVDNCHDWKSVLERAQQPLDFANCTRSTLSRKQLEALLDSDKRKFITIGRFSPEKNHEALLKAFARYHQENPKSCLIIIGSEGPLYEQTKKQAKRLGISRCTAILCPLENPMWVLKKCDLFLLPSLYEGLGLVLLEADTLGVPVISSDVVGPRGFMKAHNGYLVKPDVQGIYEGMKAFDAGKVPRLNVDYDKWNEKCVEEFLELVPGK